MSKNTEAIEITKVS